MLDLDHPQTPHVFAASRQLDLILDCCKRISVSSANERRFMLEIMRPAFAALRWLAAHRFAEEPHVADAIAELERRAEHLASLSVLEPNQQAEPVARCPVCGGTATAPNKHDPTKFCSSCLDIVMPAMERIRSCEEGFGTEAI